MPITLTLAAIIASGTVLGLALLFRELLSASRRELVSAEDVYRLSMEKYRPLERLLAEEDFRYLARQKGYQPRIADRLRRERLKVFRGYLKCLRNDYRRLEAAMLLWMMNSPHDRPDLARDLLRRRLNFGCVLLVAEWRLLFYSCGFGPVDVTRLQGVLSDMRANLTRTALTRQATLA